MSDAVLHARLEAVRRRYDARWLEDDPIRWPRRFGDPADREVVAFLAATLAYGRVASIHGAVRRVLDALGPRPARAAAELAPAALRRRLSGFVHRWTGPEEVVWLLAGVRRILEAHGSLGALATAAARGKAPLCAALTALHAALADPRAARDDAQGARRRAFLVPDPRGGAACKRLLLFARWCVRPDDGIDLGLWRPNSPASGGLAPKDLLVPLDVHAHRTALDLGLTRRRRPDWRAAEEVTAAFRRFAPDDPTRYDFALVRPGIVGRCRHAWDAAICGACDLAPCCRVATSGSRSPRRGTRTTPAPPAST